MIARRCGFAVLTLCTWGNGWPEAPYKLQDCAGPSSHWKAQGKPVRVWGLLADGLLFITVLPEGNVMNRWWYEWVVERRFDEWLGTAFGRNRLEVFVVQDHERALWTPEPRAAMRRVGIRLLENFAKCSQDLNPIEQVWKELRGRLATTQPVEMETRASFIDRLRSAVAWVNRNRADFLWTICNSQKDWTQDVRDAKGARTKH